MKRTFCFLVLLTLPVVANAQGLANWINLRRAEILKARADQADVASKQVESPAAAAGSTSLVDQSSAADLFSAALNFAGISNAEGEEEGNDAKTLSFTAYSLLAAAKGFDPLEPAKYNLYRNWRHLSFTVGSSDTETLYSLKYNFIDRRDPQRLNSLNPFLTRAANATGTTVLEVRRYIFENADVRARLEREFSVRAVPDDADALRRLEDPDVLETILDDANLAEIDEIIERNSAPFAELEEATRGLVAELQANPQLSLTGTYKRANEGPDGVVAELVYDQGMRRNVTITGNLGYEFTQANGNNAENDFFRLAGQLRYQFPGGTADSRRFLDFAAEANNKDDENTFKAQVKYTLPITAGIELPLSLTWANRQELIEESEIRGLIGFTLDYSKVLDAFRARN